MAAAPAIANVLRPKGSYAIIGPGGGVDVLRAVANGSQRAVGIEINPIIVNGVMRGRFADYAHHLYDIPEIEMHVSDGRSWIRSSHERFDVVQMTLVDTWASTAAGAFALSENNLYTREAFREYFQHLKPDGFLAITRWEFRRPREALRVVSEAIDALSSLGVPQSQLAQHFIVVSDGKLDEDGRPVTVLASRSAFTRADEAALRANVVHVAAGMYGARLRELFGRTDVAINLHGEPYPTFENRVCLHLAAGHLVLSEPLSPTHGLEPGIDYVEFRTPADLVGLIAALRRAPGLYASVRARGRMKAEQFRASRMWPRLVADLVRDVKAFGTARRVAAAAVTRP